MTFKHSLAALAVACAGTAAHAAPTWITVGDDALAVLRQVAPRTQVLSSTQVAVTVPASRGSSTLVQASEGVHALEIDDDMLPSFSMKVHQELRKCGGFIQHASMAEALAALHFLGKPAQPDLAPSYVIDDVAQVNALLPQLQASNILSTISSLSGFQNRRYNSTHGVAASNWLFNLWSQLGANGRRDVRVTQVTHTGNWLQKSVSFEINGTGNSGEVILIGGHLDSISPGSIETARSPGADDDASGVATMTEMIRVMMESNYVPKRTVRFVAYAAEEVGLLGSQQIVAAYRGERRKVVGVMQLDMTAFQGDATDLWIYTDYTNAAQNAFVANLAAQYLPELSVGYDRCGYGCSDHAAWHNAGYAASFPHEASNTTYNRAIHTPNDTIATFGNQADHALKFAKLALAYTVELANDSTPAVATVAAPATRTAGAAPARRLQQR